MISQVLKNNTKTCAKSLPLGMLWARMFAKNASQKGVQKMLENYTNKKYQKGSQKERRIRRFGIPTKHTNLVFGPYAPRWGPRAPQITNICQMLIQFPPKTAFSLPGDSQKLPSKSTGMMGTWAGGRIEISRRSAGPLAPKAQKGGASRVRPCEGAVGCFVSGWEK